MALKKKSKANSSFNMSSLTDIIFLLLIFFMLTSTLVAPNSLNLKLPGSSSTSTPSTRNIDRVRIQTDGSFSLNRHQITLGNLEQVLKQKADAEAPEKLNVAIAPDKETPTEHLVAIMDIALRLDINGVLSLEK